MNINDDLKAINKDIRKSQTTIEKVSKINYWLTKLQYIYIDTNFTVKYPTIEIKEG